MRRVSLPVLLLVLAALLLAVVAPLAAAEPGCYWQVGGGDYQCLFRSSYSGTQEFQSYCLDQAGTYLADAANSPYCTLKCCCEQDGTDALFDGPVAQAYCQAQASYRYLPSGTTGVAAGSDCVALCGGTAGGGGTTTHAVSGTVYDDGTGPATPLAAAKVEYPVGSVLITAYTDDTGSYSLPDVAEGDRLFKASKLGCGADQEARTIGGDTTLDFHLDCTTGGCAARAVNDTDAVPVPGKAQATVTWTASDCAGVAGYAVYRCPGDGNGACAGDEIAIGTVPAGTGTITDEAVPTDDTAAGANGFCYLVAAINASGDEIAPDNTADTTGQRHCVRPMSASCVDGTLGLDYRCVNDDTAIRPFGNPDESSDGRYGGTFTGAVRCDAENVPWADQNNVCQDGEYCYYTSPPRGNPTCGSATQCDACNGLFGWFVDSAAQVLPGVTTTCARLLGCYRDNTGKADDLYTSCGAVKSCYDYHSASACAGAGDRCGVSSKGCQWVAPPELAALGKGACIPADTAETDCGACTDAFGFCNATLCEHVIGRDTACYYNALSGATGEPAAGSCVSKKEMACRYYDTESDCVGSGPTRPAIDVTYDDAGSSDGNRTGGTNAVTDAGRDYFGFDRCAWFPDADGTGGYCIKEANGRLVTLPDRVQPNLDDCEEQSVGDLGKCYRDVTPPTTTLPFTANEFVDAARLRAATPVVYDAAYGYLDYRTVTWFCLAPGSGTCYPDTRLSLLLADRPGVGSYTLSYYSTDPAGNLEPVQRLPLTIEQDSDAHLIEARLVG